MAHQLSNLGDEIAFLAIVNTELTSYLENYLPQTTSLHKFYYRIKDRVLLERDNLAVLEKKEKTKYIIERIRKTKSLLQYKIEKIIDKPAKKLGIKTNWHSLGYFMEELATKNAEICYPYKLNKYMGKAFLFKASEIPSGIYLNNTLGWEKYFNGGINVVEVQGYHKNILQEPNVRELARKIQFYLNESASEH